MPSFDANTPIVKRVGHRDYIKLRNGQDGVVRVWNHHTGQWRLTKLGREWAARRQSEYVVSIPVRFVIGRKDGSEQEFWGYLPASNVRMHGELKEAMALAGGDVQRRGGFAIALECRDSSADQLLDQVGMAGRCCCSQQSARARISHDEDRRGVETACWAPAAYKSVK